MDKFVKRELWLMLVPFPVSLAIGKVVEFMLSREQQVAALDWQHAMMADLGTFTPVMIVYKIGIIGQHAFGEWAKLLTQGLGGIIAAVGTLPFRLIQALFDFIASIWASESTLTSLFITMIFGYGFIGAFGFLHGRTENLGPFIAVPAVLGGFLIGSFACAALWLLCYVSLLAFGWFTSLAIVCTSAAGIAAAGVWLAVNYAGYRLSKAVEPE